jgi:high-affinity nickel permease
MFTVGHFTVVCFRSVAEVSADSEGAAKKQAWINSITAPVTSRLSLLFYLVLGFFIVCS